MEEADIPGVSVREKKHRFHYVALFVTLYQNMAANMFWKCIVQVFPCCLKCTLCNAAGNLWYEHCSGFYLRKKGKTAFTST